MHACLPRHGERARYLRFECIIFILERPVRVIGACCCQLSRLSHPACSSLHPSSRRARAARRIALEQLGARTPEWPAASSTRRAPAAAAAAAAPATRTTACVGASNDGPRFTQPPYFLYYRASPVFGLAGRPVPRIHSRMRHDDDAHILLWTAITVGPAVSTSERRPTRKQAPQGQQVRCSRPARSNRLDVQIGLGIFFVHGNKQGLLHLPCRWSTDNPGGIAAVVVPQPTVVAVALIIRV